MGWWKEAGLTLGDGPADRFDDCLNEVQDSQPFSLATFLWALDQAFRRNPAAFVLDPQGHTAAFVALPEDGGAQIEPARGSVKQVEACQAALEAIALEYSESGLERLPSLSELLANAAFVLRPLVPTVVFADPDFRLGRIACSQKPEEILLLEVRWRELAPLLEQSGLTRDPDALPQPTNPPEFASWTRQPDLGLELDWHAPRGEPAWVEVRGAGAGRLAALLAEQAGGRIAPSPTEALANLLTVPPAKAPASTGNAETRWIMLATLLAQPVPPDPGLSEALTAAGLADTDWRVRMAALWAVGQWRLARLADAARAVRLPPPDFAGLNGDDRHGLLGLRDVAVARATGTSPVADSDRKHEFLAAITACFDSPPRKPESRLEALFLALRLRPERDQGQVPRAWKSWWIAPDDQDASPETPSSR